MIAFLAMAYSSWAIWGAGYEYIAKGFMLLIAGIPVYLWVRWRASKAEETLYPPLPGELPPAPAERHDVAAPLP